MSSGERECPHCGAAKGTAAARDETVQRAVQTSIDEIERHNRRIFEIAGLSADETASLD
jgi:uncharacterized Zn finger protein (UPF0148 family)